MIRLAKLLINSHKKYSCYKKYSLRQSLRWMVHKIVHLLLPTIHQIKLKAAMQLKQPQELSSLV